MGLINVYKNLMRGVKKADSSDYYIITGKQARATN